MRKSRQALASARQLLEAGDADNCAYYTMFDAAQAALQAVDIETTANAAKTQRGLAGHLPAELGSSIDKVERLRLLADYTGDPVSNEDSAWAVAQGDAFIAAIQDKFGIG